MFVFVFIYKSTHPLRMDGDKYLITAQRGVCTYSTPVGYVNMISRDCTCAQEPDEVEQILIERDISLSSGYEKSIQKENGGNFPPLNVR